MRLSPEIIAKIQDAADIVDVIGESVNLRRRGQNYLGLCPFHNEKTPSFNVSPSRNIYKCFGCGKGGNVFTFLQEKFGMSFIEAVESLAAKYHIELPKYLQEESESETRRSKILNVLEISCREYSEILYRPEGKIAKDYFASRGFDDAIIEQFRLGYSPEDWQFIINKLGKSNISIDLIEEAGIAVKSEKGNYFDRFRGRAIFPIQDFLGRIIGFGGRQLINDSSGAKYINSPQTSVYDKSKVLYGIYQAKNNIRSKEFSILVEGYADVISLHIAGFNNTVASSGTAVTKEQLRELKRFSTKLYVAYDADDAGQEATERAGELALESGFDAFVVEIPENEDPDSIIKKFGKKKFEYLLNNAITFIDFKIKRLKTKFTGKSAGELTQAIREVTKIVASIPDTLQHGFYLRTISDAFNLTYSQVELLFKEAGEYRNILRIKEIADDKRDLHINIESKQTGIAQKQQELSLNSLLFDEIIILRYALKGLNEFSDLMEHFDISTDLFYTHSAKLIFKVIQQHSTQNDILSDIINSSDVHEDFKSLILTMVISEEKDSENWHIKFNRDEFVADMKKAINDSLIRLKVRNTEKQIQEINKLMRAEPENPNHLLRYKELCEIRNELMNQIINI